MKNKIELLSDSLIDVLRFSDSKFEYPDLEDIQEGEVEPSLFYTSVSNSDFSELNAILQYTQQSVLFDKIGEILLGISIVEMKHYDKLLEVVKKLGGRIPFVLDKTIISLGTTQEQCLKIAIESELKAIENYNYIIRELRKKEESKTVVILRNLIIKLFRDEVKHLDILKEELLKIISEEAFEEYFWKELPIFDLFSEQK